MAKKDVEDPPCPDCGHGVKQHDMLSCTTPGCVCFLNFTQVRAKQRKR